jgi:isoleucyl-tRNA synthetase
MEMRKRNGMLDKSCASKNTNVLECWFDSSHAYICRKEDMSIIIHKIFAHENCIFFVTLLHAK